MRRLTIVGIVVIAIGLVPWGLWTLYDSTRTWFFAKDVPITLSNGSHYETGWIKTNMGGLYSIYINADIPKGISDHATEAEKEMACETGVNDPKRDPCPGPPVWNFNWTLTSDGTRVDGGSAETTGSGGINSAWGIEREIGEFKAEKGHRYKFDLNVLFDNRDPRITNPRLMIALDDYQAGSSMFISGLLGIICGAIASVGALIVVGSLLQQWWERRQAARL